MNRQPALLPPNTGAISHDRFVALQRTNLLNLHPVAPYDQRGFHQDETAQGVSLQTFLIPMDRKTGMTVPGIFNMCCAAAK
jgi:hypothetical protein